MIERVIAAVPTYNTGGHLLALAKDLAARNFDAVYVLDDASTHNPLTQLQQQHPDFIVVRGERTKGPGGNRNRILGHVASELIVFIDADMSLAPGGDIAAAARRALGEVGVGLVGGHIVTTEQHPMWWNYGFEMHSRKDAWFWHVLTTLSRPDLTPQHRAELLRQLQGADADFHWVHPHTIPTVRRQVDWVAEGLFAVRGELFKALGGYDENMSYHEGQDLARRVRDQGLGVVFDPSFEAMHHAIKSAGERDAAFREGQFYFYHKHWGMSRQVFDALYD